MSSAQVLRHTQAPVAAQSSAAHPEIALLIFRHLQRDRIDLVALSAVSRLFLQIAMPLLLEELDMPLSILGSFLAAYRSQTARIWLQHVKYLRLWDDEVVQQCRSDFDLSHEIERATWRQQMSAQVRAHPDREQHDPRWSEQAVELFGILSDVQHQSLPLIDLTFSVISSCLALTRTFTTFPVFATRITALRVISHSMQQSDVGIFPEPESVVIDLEAFLEMSVEMHAYHWQQALTDLIGLVDTAQDGLRPSALKVFASEEVRTHGGIPSSPTTLSTLLDHLRPRVRDLILAMRVSDFSRCDFEAAFGGTWPNLRRFRLDVSDDCTWMDNLDWAETWTEGQDATNAALAQNEQLEDVIINAEGKMILLPAYFGFSAVRRISLSEGCLRAEDVHALLARNPGLVEVDAAHGAIENLGSPHSALTSSGRHFHVFRGSFHNLLRLLEAGHSFSHINFDSDQSLRCIDEIRNVLDATRAGKVTCVTLRTSSLKIDDVTAVIGAALHWTQYPNLAELVLSIKKSTSGWEPITSRLRRLLLATRSMKELRVLCVLCDSAEALPPCATLRSDLQDQDFPPSLEYLDWYVAKENRMQYLRILSVPVLGEEYTRELAYLPASSRCRVDEDGVWNQSVDLEASRMVLDHTVFPPRLLA